jgi:acetyl esterase
MSIDAQLAAYYRHLAEQYTPLPPDADGPTRRGRFAETARQYAVPRPVGVDVGEIDIPLAGRTLKGRVYRPAGMRAVDPLGELAPPLVIYFRGGGWVIGDLDTHDVIGAHLALDAQVGVVSVDYRLAPEHPFPAACDDALDAVLWLAEQRTRLGFSASKLALGGDSAGAHLAASAAGFANARIPGLVKAQLLFYPAVTPQADASVYKRHADEPGLSSGEMTWYWGAFLADYAHTATDVRASLMAMPPDTVPPPAIVAVAGYDLLYDEGVAYARFLEQHGARVELIDADDMTHGFARLQGQSDAAREWARKAGEALGRLARAGR